MSLKQFDQFQTHFIVCSNYAYYRWLNRSVYIDVDNILAILFLIFLPK